MALLGTGIMGAGMARSMRRAGLPVRVWNRTGERARALASEGVTVCEIAEEAVRGADIVMTMLADGPAVHDAMTLSSPGFREGQVWAQTSTVGVASLDRLAGLARDYGLVFVDAPVLGTRQPAERGELTVFAAGPDGSGARLRALLTPVFEAIGQRTLWLGQVGQATRLKLAANSWVLALTNAVGESLALSRGLGLDPELFLQVIAGGPTDCQYLHVKARAILTGDLTPSFSAALAGKDARLITEAAETAGLRLDVAAAGAERFRRTAELGHGEEDMAAVYFASFDSTR